MIQQWLWAWQSRFTDKPLQFVLIVATTVFVLLYIKEILKICCLFLLVSPLERKPHVPLSLSLCQTQRRTEAIVTSACWAISIFICVIYFCVTEWTVKPGELTLISNIWLTDCSMPKSRGLNPAKLDCKTMSFLTITRLLKSRVIRTVYQMLRKPLLYSFLQTIY